MDEDDGLHRLEGSTSSSGGLVIKKKSNDSAFKVPKPSLLGLDKLAAAKREQQKRLMSFSQEDADDDIAFKEKKHKSTEDQEKGKRQYRSVGEETPTYTGGLTEEAKERMMHRMQR